MTPISEKNEGDNGRAPKPSDLRFSCIDHLLKKLTFFDIIKLLGSASELDLHRLRTTIDQAIDDKYRETDLLSHWQLGHGADQNNDCSRPLQPPDPMST